MIALLVAIGVAALITSTWWTAAGMVGLIAIQFVELRRRAR